MQAALIVVAPHSVSCQWSITVIQSAVYESRKACTNVLKASFVKDR